MKRPLRMGVLCAAFLLPLTGCFTMRHTVGTGGTTTVVAQGRQWFALWGLVPINQVNGGTLAGGAANYTIQTQQSFVDVLINIVTAVVTIYSRTVTVSR